MRIDNKRIVITGAASGIGRALLQCLAALPCQMVAADIDAERLEATVANLPSPSAHIIPFVGNLAEQASVDTLFETALTTMGGIDLFIANAGFAYYEVFNGDWAHTDAIYRLNVYSPLYALHRMTQLHPADPFTVVIIASAMAKVGAAGYALYASTKAALDRFADAYRLEQPPNAHLLMVYPIGTRTHFFQAANLQRAAPVIFPSQTPEYVAAAILRGIEADLPSVTPSILFLLAELLHRVIPVLKIHQLYTRVQFSYWRAAQKRGR